MAMQYGGIYCTIVEAELQNILASLDLNIRVRARVCMSCIFYPAALADSSLFYTPVTWP